MWRKVYKITTGQDWTPKLSINTLKLKEDKKLLQFEQQQQKNQ